ncbi:hypothetical protein MCP1_350033 [Candidatus Terasakiella magnetica]|nr:hypothetical protein MCP1_350033 [Candidatus Terasakiella magnetica]
MGFLQVRQCDGLYGGGSHLLRTIGAADGRILSERAEIGNRIVDREAWPMGMAMREEGTQCYWFWLFPWGG